MKMQSSAPSALPAGAAVMRKIQPREFYRRFVLESECRPDLRALSGFRPVSVTPNSISSSCGSAMVAIGSCKLLAVAKCEVTVPDASRPRNGFLVPNVELPPLCDANKFRAGPPSSLAQSLSQTIDEICHRSPPFDLAALCIDEGLAAWVVYIDFYCLSYDGSLLDACLLGLAAVLRLLRLPDIDFDPELGTVRLKPSSIGKTEKLSSLVMLRVPISSSFVCIESKLVADPTAEEEGLIEQTHSVVIDAAAPEGRDVLAVIKTGGEPVQFSTITDSIVAARTRARQLASMLDNKL